MITFDVHTTLEGFVIPGYNQSASQMKQQMQARSIDQFAVMSSRAIDADPLSGNRILSAMIEQEQGVYGILVAHLNRVDASLQAMRELLSRRRFIGVALVQSDMSQPLHPLVADEVLNGVRRFQKPIFLHTPNADCVEVALELSKTYNMHKFVFLGMGGHDWRTAIAAAHQSVNIYLEVSGSLDRAKIPAAIEGIGSHRILFGSGMPILDPTAILGLIDDSGLSSIDQKRILHDNAAKLFQLDAIEN